MCKRNRSISRIKWRKFEHSKTFDETAGDDNGCAAQLNVRSDSFSVSAGSLL
jgi:hypothetical protein